MYVINKQYMLYNMSNYILCV